MAKMVYVLGAGFNCSVLGPSPRRSAPLARNFFKVLFQFLGRTPPLPVIDRHLPVDALFQVIEHYWHLDPDALRKTDFDIEECLTFIQLRLADKPPDEHNLRDAEYALVGLLRMYLGELRPVISPAGSRFGKAVHDSSADVLTFNYDSLAETAIESASPPHARMPPKMSLRSSSPEEVHDDDLDACHSSWNRNLAFGTAAFTEVVMPVAGTPTYVSGDRYYSHPRNQLYTDRRVLKLHGSIDWLEYSKRRYSEILPFEESPPPGIVLSRNTDYTMGELPARNGWYMTPRIIPPQLYKKFDCEPFPAIWETALSSLSECESLTVIGYSFPQSDFRTRRLFLEAFSDHDLRALTVVNPDSKIISIVRDLTHYDGPVTSCDDLRSAYGVRPSWFPE